jgi:hypothetical protein
VAINYLGGLKRQFDHVKVAGSDNQDVWQAVMVILRHQAPGKSFMITREAIWKYIEPRENRDPKTISADMEEFDKLVIKNRFARKVAATYLQKGVADADLACIGFAIGLNMTNRIMLCTGYNLAKIMQMMTIEARPEAAAQLLMWIQDGLDELKNLPDAPPDAKQYMGEVTIFNGGQKMGTKDITMDESEVIIESNEQ